MNTSSPKKQFKKSALIVSIMLILYYLTILALMTFYPINSGGAEKKEILDVLLGTAFTLFVLPIGGALLILYGLDVTLKKGWEGLVPAEIVGVFSWFGGLALIIAPPILIIFESLIFPEKVFSELNAIYGFLVLTVVIPVALLTLVLHGGSDLVQKDGFGRWLKSLRESLSKKVFEASKGSNK